VPTDPTAQTPGRSLVSRRALTDIVRTAALGSYGVTGFRRRGADRLLEWLGRPTPGIRIGLRDELTVDLDLTVAHRLPIAEVARQVDSSVRHAIRKALGREVTHLTIHVDGLRAGPIQPASWTSPAATAGRRPPKGRRPAAIAPDDLAASGTDVA